uniref:Uncharacterized protein n=1 Tax=Trypanosoma vivax (strain Y486) TaxID=1055687 RepID=G0UCI0_TRYVY|nr:hypothetical protein, unlikely [Trypanosoma vivax Y486]
MHVRSEIKTTKRFLTKTFQRSWCANGVRVEVLPPTCDIGKDDGCGRPKLVVVSELFSRRLKTATVRIRTRGVGKGLACDEKFRKRHPAWFGGQCGEQRKRKFESVKRANDNTNVVPVGFIVMRALFCNAAKLGFFCVTQQFCVHLRGGGVLCGLCQGSCREQLEEVLGVLSSRNSIVRITSARVSGVGSKQSKRYAAPTL